MEYIIRSLPKDILQNIVVPYYPLCLLIMDDKYLAEYDWNKQAKIIFNMSCDSAYTYYCLCLRFDKNYKNIIAGYNSSFILRNGILMCCGDNSKGQLGMDSTDYVTKFTEIERDVVQVACGRYHTVILKADGTMHGCGRDYNGELGVVSDGWNMTTFLKFTEITAIKKLCPQPGDITQIACSHSSSTVILRADGAVITNSYKGFQIEQDLPKDIIRIVCGEHHIIAIRANGVIMGKGYNRDAQLGFISGESNVDAWRQIGENAIKVAAGEYYTIILKQDGSLRGYGDNTHGQLGDNNPKNHISRPRVRTSIATHNNIRILPRDIVDIVCGSSHTILLRANGNILNTGSNAYGQLGLLRKIERRTNFGGSLTNVTQIACGANHTIVMKVDGSIMSCGNNTYGQLGHGDTCDKGYWQGIAI